MTRRKPRIVGLAMLTVVTIGFVPVVAGSLPASADGPASVTQVSLLPAVEPQVMSYDPTSGNVVLDDVQSNSLQVYSPRTGTVIKTVPLNVITPWSLGRNPSTGEFYVPAGGDGKIATVNLATGTEIDVQGCVGGVADVSYYATSNLVFFTCWDGNYIGAFDATTHEVMPWHVPAGTNPAGLGIDSSTQTLYATDFGSGQVTVVSLPASERTTPSVRATVNNVGAGAWGMTWTATELLVPASQTSEVAVIDRGTNTVKEYIPVGVGPRNIVQVPGSHRAYVTNFESDTVSIINMDTLTTVGTVDVGIGPHGIIYVPGSNTIFVTNRLGDTLSYFAPPNPS